MRIVLAPYGNHIYNAAMTLIQKLIGLHPEDLRKLKALAKKSNTTTSHQIREAVRLYLLGVGK